MPREGTGPDFIESLARGLEVITAFEPDRPSMTLAEVATALDCTLVYALVPNSTLEQTVMAQARKVAAEMLGYVARTMALEAQQIDSDRQHAAIDRYARQLTASGKVWRAARDGLEAGLG